MRVIIADPNDDRRRRACKVLSQIKGLTLVGSFPDLTGTFNAVEHKPPTVVLVTPELSKQPDFEMMEVLFKCLAVRWMMCGTDRERPRTGASATQVGFVSFDDDPNMIATALSRRTRGLSEVAPSAPAGLLRSSANTMNDNIVLIGSSTGGIDALLRVLGSFPRDCPPTLIVQHTGGAFSEGLARLLNQRVEPNVREARDGDRPQVGTVLLAPGSEKHLVLDTRNGIRCRLDPRPKVSGHRPSVDALFSSAQPIAKQVTGVILTGMGRDGAEGLLELKNAGARTIGQDKETCVVYGMPGHAASIGAVIKPMPLLEIGPAILRPLRRSA